MKIIQSKVKKDKWYSWYSIYECHCGKQTLVKDSAVRQGQKSCGCTRTITHGLSSSPEFQAWSSIKKRCLKPNNNQYKDYGARGISICKEWKNSFEDFYKDMGPRPSLKHSIDRIDNNKGYSKENCRWATMSEQNLNKRNSRKLSFNNETKSLTEWSRITGIKFETLRSRLSLNWPIERALTEPPKKR